MTASTPTAVVHTQASLTVRAAVLPRATWETEIGGDGRMTFRPKKGTWHGHIVRGSSRFDRITVPMIACPSCAGVLFLSPSPEAARALSKMLGVAVPQAHRIDSLGKVTPDVLCKHGRCDFHRKVYLDRYRDSKPLYACAYVNLDAGQHGAIEIAYSHARTATEARHHLGRGNYRVIGAGPAIGFFVNEQTGRVTTD